jgi:two-component system, LytTR family, response regulator
MPTAVVLDDELNGARSLETLIRENCPDVNTVSVETDPLLALGTIKKLKPEILFLDIEMPKLNGFELLAELTAPLPKVIFTTAYDHYAVQAFRHNAIDYLLKPVIVEELISSVSKVKERIRAEKALLEQEQSKGSGSNRKVTIAVECQSELIVIDTANIIRLEADSNYTHIYLIDGKRITSAKTLKEYEDQLLASDFYRIHRTTLINAGNVERYVRGEDAHVVMKDKSCLEVSRRKKTDFLLFFYKRQSNTAS